MPTDCALEEGLSDADPQRPRHDTLYFEKPNLQGSMAAKEYSPPSLHPACRKAQEVKQPKHAQDHPAAMVYHAPCPVVRSEQTSQNNIRIGASQGKQHMEEAAGRKKKNSAFWAAQPPTTVHA